MDNNSFSTFIKKEILDFNWTKREKEILFFSFLQNNLKNIKNKWSFNTSLLILEDKINLLFQEILDLNIIPIKLKTILKYELEKEALEKIEDFKNNLILKSINDSKAFLAGVFLGKGWINSPNSRFYHCELRIKDVSQSLDIQESLFSLGIKASTLEKGNWYYTYIKKSSEISNFIKAINAFQSIMFFEDSRIQRDFFSTIKKMESIEGHNLELTINASMKQVKAINKIFKNNRQDLLSEDLLKLSKLRLEKPNNSLYEIQIEFNSKYKKNLSKSTINNWFNKIIDISNII